MENNLKYVFYNNYNNLNEGGEIDEKNNYWFNYDDADNLNFYIPCKFRREIKLKLY